MRKSDKNKNMDKVNLLTEQRYLGEDENSAFIPIVGMVPKDPKSNGYKGRIEHVGEDYFVLRSFRHDNDPILIKPFQYKRFKEWGYYLPKGE